MARRNDYIIIGIILLIVAGGLFYYTINPIGTTYTTEEYVTKERVIIKERIVPQETVVKKTRDVVTYKDSVIVDSYKDFLPGDYIVIAEPLLKPGDRIEYTIATEPDTPDVQRWFHFVILDNHNYDLWLMDDSHAALFVNEIGEYSLFPLKGIWTVPAKAGIQQYKIVLSNRYFVYPKRLTYTIIKKEPFVTKQEYLEKVTQNITQTYEVTEQYQELETVTKTGQELPKKYRPISYIVGALGILTIILGFLTTAHRERIKRIQEFRQTIRTKYRPQDIPKCPKCGSKVIDTHVEEDGIEIYKCTNCQHLFETY